MNISWHADVFAGTRRTFLSSQLQSPGTSTQTTSDPKKWRWEAQSPRRRKTLNWTILLTRRAPNSEHNQKRLLQNRHLRRDVGGIYCLFAEYESVHTKVSIWTTYFCINTDWTRPRSNLIKNTRFVEFPTWHTITYEKVNLTFCPKKSEALRIGRIYNIILSVCSYLRHFTPSCVHPFMKFD